MENLYTKKDFIIDVKSVEGISKQEELAFWSTQYDMYALGERGVLIHDTTLVFMSPYTQFQKPEEQTVEELLERRKHDSN